MQVAIIGGGAAGFFAAVNVKENYPEARVTIYEKSNKLLSKVKVSGGGRCNVTNGTTSIKKLSENYPRGGKKLKKLFQVFSTQDTRAWFEERGVKTYVQNDQRVFPLSDNSQTIIDCFFRECKRLDIQILMGEIVQSAHAENEKIKLTVQEETIIFDKVIITTGGSPKKDGLIWLERLGHKIEEPVPSLFTFNMPQNPITNLKGLVAENVQVSIQGEKLKSSGPLLITHWGMSGPAILKLSAFGARMLSDKKYQFSIQVNWANTPNQEEVIQSLKTIIDKNPNKSLANLRVFDLPQRLWLFLLEKGELPSNKKFSELGKKGLNKLVNVLTNDIYFVKGKTTFKEEFVTCGGISLDSVDMNTMQSKVCENLYFAGEVLDIDGVTGGYNFQAAWTTAYISARLN